MFCHMVAILLYVRFVVARLGCAKRDEFCVRKNNASLFLLFQGGNSGLLLCCFPCRRAPVVVHGAVVFWFLSAKNV